MSDTKIYEVTNRSGSNVFYTIDEDNINRHFTPGEVKKIPYEELEKLSYQIGGKSLINNYLLIKNSEALNQLDLEIEPEYNMDANAVKKLLLEGSLDALLDALDFAPGGVIELIKDIAVALPLNDMSKRKAIQDKTNFNVSAAIQHIEEEKLAAQEEGKITNNSPKQRRVQPEEKPAGRRTTPNYNVVSTGE